MVTKVWGYLGRGFHYTKCLALVDVISMTSNKILKMPPICQKQVYIKLYI